MPLSVQQAQAHWVDGEYDNRWRVADKAGETLGFLPSKLTAQEVMDVVRFAREFELLAFNDGVEEGLRRHHNALEFVKEDANARIRSLEFMNIELSQQLEQLIEEGV